MEPERSVPRRERGRQYKKLPAWLTAGLFWVLWLLLVLLVDPASVADFGLNGSYSLFFLLLFMALFLTGGLLLKSIRRGLFMALTVVIYLFLRLKGVGSVFNLVILGMLFVVLEMFLKSKR